MAIDSGYREKACCNDDKGDSWSPDDVAISVERVRDDEGISRISGLRHPTHPFVRQIPAGPELPNALRGVANDYIARIRDMAELGAAADLLLAADPDGFGWLELAWGGDSDRDPGLSFWVTRRDPQGAVRDQTAVLVAANRHVNGTAHRSEGMAVGLSVVMHLGPSGGPGTDVVVRVTGANFSGLSQARAPDASLATEIKALASTQKQAQSAFGFGQTSITGYAAQTEGGIRKSLRLAGTGTRGIVGAERVYAWRAHLVYSDDGQEATLVPGDTVEQVSHMANEVAVFAADPASRSVASTEVARRPTRKANKLNLLRTWAAHAPAVLKAPGTLFEVHQSVVADRQADPDQLQALPLGPKPGLRSDRLSAAHAYARGSELFERFSAYGLPAHTYFKEAQLPLVLRHRAWFYAQPDGLTVNAEVRYSGERKSLADPSDALVRPQLEVRFGAANLTHREVRSNDHGQARAQPLGLAADPRWAWHEFGHVLAFASTGALEFPFAHSAGDALAAIIADPDSHLAHHNAGAGHERSGMSGYTFPWVLSSRRHDRPAMEGWCWCGRRNKARHARLRFPPALFNGYTEEQMLSSSLFMFYRCIGGDTWGAGPGAASVRRHAASDYAVYLIMQAMTLLGPSSITPASSVDALVSALIQADIGTGDWHVTGQWRGSAPRLMHRVGGTAHKVLRWAFEQQGLYATLDPNENVEGPGLPPPVDVYIPGLQDRSGGGYAPVPLNWTTDPTDPAPAWYANPTALAAESGFVHVTVGNRGDQVASGMSLRAWAADVALPLVWVPLVLSAPGPSSLSGGGAATYHFAAKDAMNLPLRGAWLVVVEASCLGDRSNLDPLTLLPCSGATPPVDVALLIDLVANDNNLGLRAIDFG